MPPRFYIATTRDDVDRALVLLGLPPVPCGPLPHPVAVLPDGGWLLFDDRIIPTKPGMIYKIENPPLSPLAIPPLAIAPEPPSPMRYWWWWPGRRWGAQRGLADVHGKVRACPGADPTCPCVDGLACHYEGPGAWPTPRDEEGR